MVRPNGKPYQRRAPIRTYAWENDDDSGVLVLGTLDPAIAHPHAVNACRHWYSLQPAPDPEPGWYRLAFHQGERMWTFDGDRGQPGLMFTAEEQP